MRNIYSPNEIEREMYDYINYYKNNEPVINSVKNIQKDINSYKYSKGGECYFRGYYCPFNDFRLSDADGIDFGHPVKNTSKYNYIYGFCDQKLIYVKTMLGIEEFEEFIAVNDGIDLGVEINSYYNDLSAISIVKYTDDNYPKLIALARVRDYVRRFDVEFDYEKIEYNDDFRG